MTEQQLSEIDFFKLMIDEVGMVSALRLIGFALLWSAAGYQTFEDLKGKPAWSRTTEWRAIRDLKHIRARLEREGKVPPLSDELRAERDYAAARDVAQRWVEARERAA